MPRDALCEMIVGAPGSGKTTLARKFMQREPVRTLVVVPDGSQFTELPWFDIRYWENLRNFRGAMRIMYGDEGQQRKILRQVSTHFRNGLLLLEDMRTEMPATTASVIRSIIGNRRHKAIDVIGSVHGFSGIPPAWIQYVSIWHIFRTTDNIFQRKRYFNPDHYAQLEKITQRVNRGSRKIKWYHETYQAY